MSCVDPALYWWIGNGMCDLSPGQDCAVGCCELAGICHETVARKVCIDYGWNFSEGVACNAVPACAAAAVPVINSPLFHNAFENILMTYQITATNSPTSFAAVGLPAWLSMNATGLISGTHSGVPAFNNATYNFAITATNAAGSDTQNLAINYTSLYGDCLAAGYPGGLLDTGECMSIADCSSLPAPFTGCVANDPTDQLCPGGVIINCCYLLGAFAICP